jgi:hypothetical protein
MLRWVCISQGQQEELRRKETELRLVTAEHAELKKCVGDATSRLHLTCRSKCLLTRLLTMRPAAVDRELQSWIVAARTIKSRFERMRAAFYALQRRFAAAVQSSAIAVPMKRCVSRDFVTPADPHPVLTRIAMERVEVSLRSAR